MLSPRNAGLVALTIAGEALAQTEFHSQNVTWNSNFSLTQEQADSLNLTELAANNVNIVTQFDRTNWATGSVFKDAFYTSLPENAASTPAGSILYVEEFTDTANYTVPPSLGLSRIIYQSKTYNGTLVPVSAFVLWPYYPRGGGELAPLVSFGHGTAGSEAECAPSHKRNLLYDFNGLYELALSGYAVVASDYAGLGVPFYQDGTPIAHQYMASGATGNDLLYAAKAAQAAFPGKLTEDFVVLGHSQGGAAAWGAAQQQLEARVPGYLGAVAMAPPTNVLDLSQMYGSSIGMLSSIKGMLSIFPDLKASDALTTRGEALVKLLGEIGGCTVFNTILMDLLGIDPTVPLTEDEFMNSYWAKSFANTSSVGGKDFAGPLLVIQGAQDMTIPEALTTKYVNKTCDGFPDHSLRYIIADGIDHAATPFSTQQIWLQWIDERFRSVDTGASCSFETIGSTSPRPLSQYQGRINYFLSLALDSYQAP